MGYGLTHLKISMNIASSGLNLSSCKFLKSILIPLIFVMKDQNLLFAKYFSYSLKGFWCDASVIGTTFRVFSFEGKKWVWIVDFSLKLRPLFCKNHLFLFLQDKGLFGFSCERREKNQKIAIWRLQEKHVIGLGIVDWCKTIFLGN